MFKQREMTKDKRFKSAISFIRTLPNNTIATVTCKDVHLWERQRFDLCSKYGAQSEDHVWRIFMHEKARAISKY
jgi:hypothetical protein